MDIELNELASTQEYIGLCAVCSNSAKFMCSSCGPDIHYCSEACQAEDWPSHRLVCGKIALSPDPDAANNDDRNSISENVTHTRYSGRSSAAQVLNRRPEWQNIFRRRSRKAGTTTDRTIDGTGRTRSEPEPEEPLTPEEQIEELRFYMANVYLIIKPVIICIILSILWVKLTNPPQQFFDSGFRRLTNDVFNGGIAIVVGGGTAPGDSSQAAISAIIILVMIIVVTIIILVLFKYNQMKILYGIFGVIVLALLGLFGYTLGYDLLITYNGAMDYISFFFFLWNLCAVGLVVIFWKGPLLLQQIYLTVMSSKMAFALSSLPAVTTWILLSLLAVWDLIAVLCPFGPLRLLIESSRDNNREIPALLYSAAVWVGMAAPPLTSHTRPLNVAHSVADTIIDPNNQAETASAAYLVENDGNQASNDADANDLAVSSNTEDVDQAREDGEAMGDHVVASGDNDSGHPLAEDEEESTGLKLGLGDFVFYSVLVARAAVFDWITTVTVTVAVMTGLNATIFLLAIWHKALPALPISIAFGLLFYFVSSITLTPFMNKLTRVPDRYVFRDRDDSWLWVGKSGGAGFVHL